MVKPVHKINEHQHLETYISNAGMISTVQANLFPSSRSEGKDNERKQSFLDCLSYCVSGYILRRENITQFPSKPFLSEVGRLGEKRNRLINVLQFIPHMCVLIISTYSPNYSAEKHIHQTIHIYILPFPPNYFLNLISKLLILKKSPL